MGVAGADPGYRPRAEIGYWSAAAVQRIQLCLRGGRDHTRYPLVHTLTCHMLPHYNPIHHAIPSSHPHTHTHSHLSSSYSPRCPPPPWSGDCDESLTSVYHDEPTGQWQSPGAVLLFSHPSGPVCEEKTERSKAMLVQWQIKAELLQHCTRISI